MAKPLTDADLFELSQGFHDLAVGLGNFRFSQWDSLTRSQRAFLEARQWLLFNTSIDLNARSVVLKFKLLDDELALLKSSAAGMKASAAQIQDIKQAVMLATSAIALSSALYAAVSSGDVSGVLVAATSLSQILEQAVV